MKKLKLITAIYFLSCICCFSQTAPSIEWQKCLGGTILDKPNSMCLSSDNGYAIAG